MARFTPPADPSSTSLTAFVVSGLVCAAIVAALPAGMAIWAKCHRIARRFRQVSRQMDRWIEEDAPRPRTGPA